MGMHHVYMSAWQSEAVHGCCLSGKMLHVGAAAAPVVKEFGERQGRGRP